MSGYLDSMGLKLNEQHKIMTPDVFLFGSSRFKTLGKILCPVKFKDSDGKDFWIQTEVHLIDNKIGILLGLTTCDQYNVYIGTRDNEIVMKDHKEGE